MTRAFGIDTSHWDGKVDWAKAKSAGASFGIFKLTDFYKNVQTGFVDSQAANSWKGTKENGIVSGAWCWLQPKHDPKVQANYYLDAWYKYPTNMPPILDFEDRNVVSWNDMLWRACTWLEYVEEQTKKTPIVYTSLGYVNEFDKQKRSILARYPLWLAQYPYVFTANSKPTVPYPWNDWVMWQYSDKAVGAVYGGQSSTMDVNVFNGDENAMKGYFKVGQMPNQLTDAEKLAILWDAHGELHG